MKSIIVRAGSACHITKLIALGLASLFTLSCGEHGLEDIFGLNSSSSERSSPNEKNWEDEPEEGEPSIDEPGIDEGSSSSNVVGISSGSNLQLSSSSLPSSSSSAIPSSSNVIKGTPVNYQGEVYETVVIGTQTWMARNLNYAVIGSVCYNNNESNCATYGRLYNFVTAMALPSDCNSSKCASQIGAKHQGICPIGWHIPSSADWNVLMKFVNPSCSDNSISCALAGTKLKAKEGWNENGNGTDEFGFSALPGGYGSLSGNFYGIGENGHWWSPSESTGFHAYIDIMFYNYEAAYWRDYSKNNLFSVRCIKD
ncbi:MAG: fibrobacter succinogenes major paralogous domain-containing protein [Fibromonadaceae bacterium]|jgi:uncharacterized protein (TIGR02145 family)|nr:fibrobacter succinogenes major paralogous domain-containing protein [Fibromonadaceae bacterium]